MTAQTITFVGYRSGAMDMKIFCSPVLPIDKDFEVKVSFNCKPKVSHIDIADIKLLNYVIRERFTCTLDIIEGVAESESSMRTGVVCSALYNTDHFCTANLQSLNNTC
ncbi:hypothetical protein CEXT_608581 [Caerostris extrusa]|uniref:Uncharacterized protein n=1 Tax=Caerostris extrusa TaxID=172846 RepID=A0AAV4R886_CAEEX|nr:hypothetical protein CEXT_608581 [Caerostris extrusa]